MQKNINDFFIIKGLQLQTFPPDAFTVRKNGGKDFMVFVMEGDRVIKQRRYNDDQPVAFLKAKKLSEKLPGLGVYFVEMTGHKEDGRDLLRGLTLLNSEVKKQQNTGAHEHPHGANGRHSHPGLPPNSGAHDHNDHGSHRHRPGDRLSGAHPNSGSGLHHHSGISKAEVGKFEKDGFDPAAASDAKLEKDLRILARKFADMKEGVATEFDSEQQIVDTTAKVLAEIFKRGKITFEPASMRDTSVELLAMAADQIIKEPIILGNAVDLSNDLEMMIETTNKMDFSAPARLRDNQGNEYGIIRFREASKPTGAEEWTYNVRDLIPFGQVKKAESADPVKGDFTFVAGPDNNRQLFLSNNNACVKYALETGSTFFEKSDNGEYILLSDEKISKKVEFKGKEINEIIRLHKEKEADVLWKVEKSEKDKGPDPDKNPKGDPMSDKISKYIQIAKRDDEKQLVYGVVYEPEIPDAHGDIASADEIEKAAHNFLRDLPFSGSTGLNFMHEGDIRPSDAAVVESAVAQQPMMLGGQNISKGTWYIGAHLVNKDLWDDVKDGSINGFSMEGTAQYASN